MSLDLRDRKRLSDLRTVWHTKVGFWTKRVDAKVRYFPKKLIVLDKAAMYPILNHVVQKYGTDFMRLYE